MQSVVAFDAVALESTGPSLTLRLEAGRALGIFGPVGSGKSAFLRVCSGSERPGQGKVKLGGTVALAQLISNFGRLTPLGLAKADSGANRAARVAEVLAALNLWDVRKTQVGHLSPGQQVLASLIEPLVSEAKLIAIDGLLDHADPWSEPAIRSLIAERLRSGSALLIASNRAELAPKMDTVVVLSARQLKFAGPYGELERRHPSSEVIVETMDQRGVRAIAAPFEVSIEPVEGGVKFQASEGQALAAKLLTEGYGDVKSVVLKRPTPEELLRSVD